MVLRYFIFCVALSLLGIISNSVSGLPAHFFNQNEVFVNLKQSGSIFENQDTVPSAKPGIAANNSPLFSTDMVIQVGAFRKEPYANVLRDKLSSLIDHPVIKLTEDDYYKVRIVEFASLEEMEKVIRALGLLGIKSLWVFRDNNDEDTKPQAVMQADTAIKPAEMPAIVEYEPAIKDSIKLLQVGIFHKKSEALRAQRRISSNLKLPVEIIEEWDYFKVIITGFKKIEDMYKYYPKLSDLGYPITNMDENNSNKK